MAVQATVFQRPYIGLESVKGTDTPATHRLRSMGFEFNMNPEVSEFRAMGSVVNNLTALNRNSSTFNLSGQPTYDEIIWALSSIIGKTTPTQPDAINAPTAWQWVFELDTASAQDPATFTVEDVNTLSTQFTYVLLTAMNLGIARNAITMGGSGVARAVESGITPTDTSGITELPLVPILPTHFNTYVDDSYANIGNTQYTKNVAANFNLGNRYGLGWFLDRAQESFADHVPLPVDLGLELQVMKDAAGMGLLTKLENSSTAYVRVEGVGPTIADDVKYGITIDMAVQLTGGSFGDSDGMATVTWPTTGVDDTGLGTALKITVTNTQSSLAAPAGDGDGDGGDGV